MHEDRQQHSSSQESLLKWGSSLFRWANFGSNQGLVGGIVAIVAVYLVYDVLKARISPCESLYEQTAVGLKTHIRFLENEAELELGKETLTELDERGQMTALNLKTCCTVLDAGRIDPEQFLQCKAKARAYDGEVTEIVSLVKSALAEASSNSVALQTKSVAPVAPGAQHEKAGKSAPALAKALEAKVDAARIVSKEFNQQVNEVRKEQVRATLAATPVEHIDITGAEREPNDNLLSSNVLLTGTWITGAIGAPKDVDYYSFSAPDGARDRIAIEFKNQSTTLEPRLELFDAEKTSQGEVHKTTSGADLIYRFVAIPGGRHTVRVSNYYGESTGVYALRVEPTKSFDGFEPNDGILAAKPLALQQSAEANVLDGRDADYYRFPVGEGEHSLDVKVENRSTTLHPKIALFDNTKSEVGSTHNSTPGGDARYTFKANGPATYYVRVSDYYGNGSGDYTLTVATQ